MKSEDQKKKIAIVETGGTIVGMGEAGMANEYAAGKLPVSSIVDSVPALEDMAEIIVESVSSIDSNDICFNHYQAIKEVCEKLDADDEIDGIVITHGTDTLEESAFLLNLILNVHKPVIMTGAMRPATATSADGPLNLFQAIALACDKKAGDLGVLAVFSNSIFAGRDISKSNSIKTDAFKSAEFGTLGFMRDEVVYLFHTPYRPHTWQSEFTDLNVSNPPSVEIFYVHQQSDPKLLQYMLDQYDGIVLAGTGSGNYSREIQNVLETYEGPCKIVRASRLPEGAVYTSMTFDPLKKTIPALRLSPHKARLLLMLALMKTKDQKEIEEIFLKY